MLGPIDATLQRISRPGVNQRPYYSGKHKYHCVNTQGFVYPIGLLTHFSKTVEGKIHDFALLQQTNLISLIKTENINCNKLINCDCVVLADSGYQGLKKLLPCSIIPNKKPRGGQLSPPKIAENKIISHHRIVVENWFGRLKILWRIMSIAYNLDLDTYNYV